MVNEVFTKTGQMELKQQARRVDAIIMDLEGF